MNEITTSIKEQAAALGFYVCGIASVDTEADDGFDAWLGAGYQADMGWLVRSRDLRQQVRLKVTGAQSVVVLAKNYYHRDATPALGTPRIARYAWSRDYHKALSKPLKQLAAYITELCPGTEHYASIDSGPVRERVWAYRAGIGFIGRNGLIIHPRLGSWSFLATIITTAKLSPDSPIPNRCGSCRACIDACPTGAITADRIVDSRRCISYHTIENRDEIPKEIADTMKGWVFGCDICQEVCPWNRDANLENADLENRRDFSTLDPAMLATISEEEFHQTFDGTPVVRAKRDGIRRNAKCIMDFSRETHRHRL